MKIAHFVYSLATGGMEKLVADLAVLQKKSGHDVDVVCLTNSDTEFGRYLKTHGIRVFDFNKAAGFSIGLMLKLIRLMRIEKYDVIHTHNPVPNFYGAFCGRLTGVKRIVNTSHGMGNFKSTARRDMLFKLSSKFVDRNVFVCNAAMRRFVGDGLVDEKKCSVIYNGIDLYPFMNKGKTGASLRGELGIRPDSKVIGTVARLEPTKDLKTLIDSVPEVVRVFPEVIFLVVGGGSEENELKEYARKLGVENNIKFLGFRYDIPAIVDLFDIFLLTSLSEGLSLTLIEAMASEKPIIATDVGGNPEVVLDEVTGFIVEIKDIKSIVVKIRYLLKAPEKRLLMGRKAKERAVQMFSINTMAENYERIYA